MRLIEKIKRKIKRELKERSHRLGEEKILDYILWVVIIFITFFVVFKFTNTLLWAIVVSLLIILGKIFYNMTPQGFFIVFSILIAAYQLYLQNMTLRAQLDQNRSLENSIMLQEDPVLNIIPENEVTSVDGKFELSIINKGMSDVIALEIYEDYFLVCGEKKSSIQLYRPGIFSIKPNDTIKSIAKGEDKEFQINFTDILNDMQKFFGDPNVKGQKMMVARIKVNFIRKIGGKRFSYTKIFIIAAGGKVLVDYDTSRDFQPDPIIFSFDDVKRMLGATQ